MSGHSKWANTKYRKLNQDLKKEKIFTKIIREIKTIVKHKGNNIYLNHKLKSIIDKALHYNINKNTINNAIKQNICNKITSNMDFMIYEGYCFKSIAILIECLTSNKNRTIAKIRFIFDKMNCKISQKRSVSYLFDKKVIFLFDKKVNKDELCNISIDNKADDIIYNKDGTISIYFNIKNYYNIKNIFKYYKYKWINIKIKIFPLVFNNVDKNIKIKFIELIKMLKKINDVKKIYYNCIL